MSKSDRLIQFKNKVRVRVCGILENDQGILMIKHSGLSIKNIWLPPGGGSEFGETIEQALAREFKEETNLEVTIQDFLGINEYINNDLHAIELFYQVEYKRGILRLGKDPELDSSDQIIEEYKYLKRESAQKYIPVPLKNNLN